VTPPNCIEGTTTQPALGDAEANAPGLCSYERPGGTTCDGPAAWHGITPEPDPTGLESCDDGEHLAVMADLARWIHPWTSACAEGRFSLATNNCVMHPQLTGP